MFVVEKLTKWKFVFFQTLLSFLLPGHTRLRNQITEVLDLDLIKQEAVNGALDISKLAQFIIGMMGTLCAPVRDEEIKKLKDIHEIVPLFRYWNDVKELQGIRLWVTYFEFACRSLLKIQILSVRAGGAYSLLAKISFWKNIKQAEGGNYKEENSSSY